MEILNTRIEGARIERAAKEPAKIAALSIEEMLAEARRPLSPEEAEEDRLRVEENRRAVKERERAEALAGWQAKCPLRIQQNDWGHEGLRHYHAPIRRVLAWQYRIRDGQGIYAVGSPGRGKSRAIWWLARRIAVDELVPIHYLIQGDIVNDINRTGLDPFLEKMMRLRRAPVLLWDDFGTFSAMGSRRDLLASELFNLIDFRFNNFLPVLISSNVRADGLPAIFGERAEAAARRIFEGNDRVDFDVGGGG